MLESLTYLMVLFLIQAAVILTKGINWEWNLLWGFLLLFLLILRSSFFLPQDHPFRQRRHKQLLLWCFGLLFLMLSNLYLSLYVAELKNSELNEEIKKMNVSAGQEEAKGALMVQLGGEVASPIHMDGNRVRFILSVTEVAGHPFEKREEVVITHYGQTLEEMEGYARLKRGDRWRGEVILKAPDPARNPGAFDYRLYLQRKGIHFVAETHGPYQIIPGENTFSLLEIIAQFRQKWMEQTEKLFSSQVAPVVQAMTVGEWRGIDGELVTIYQDFGLIHLLAISGLHVAVVLGVIYWLLSRLPLTREQIYLLLFLFIPAYVAFSGLSVPVIRAGVMAFIVLLFLRFNWKHHALLGLYGAFALLIFIEPYALFQPGFQLSFAVTFALLTIAPQVEKLFPFRLKWLNQGLAVALVAQLVSLPIVLHHFYAFSPISFLLNLILVPIYSAFFIPGAYILTCVSFVDESSISLALFIYEGAFSFIHHLLGWLTEWPYLVLNTGRPGWWWQLVTLFCLILLALWAERRRPWRVVAATLLFVLLLAVLLVKPFLDPKGYVTVLDVGQGDAILIEAPFRQEVVLIDGGGRFLVYEEEWQKPAQPFEVGRDILLPYLKFRGINKIDKVIYSHGHFDHWGGFRGLVGRIPIGMLLRPPLPPHSQEEREWLDQVKREGIPIYVVDQGDAWSTAHAQFVVLYPQGGPPSVGTGDVHAYNLVIWNKLYNATFLWTGDVEVKGEEEIVATFPHLKADVLKVAHHGSRTSTSSLWLSRIDPKVAVISAGRNNRYGHPHREVLERLNERGIPVYVTAWQGGIRFVVGPKGYGIIPTLQGGGEPVQ